MQHSLGLLHAHCKCQRKISAYPASVLCSISAITTPEWIWFYNFTRGRPARPPPSPPQPEELWERRRLWQGDYQHTEGPPTMSCPPVGHLVPYVAHQTNTLYHTSTYYHALESPAGLLHHYHCQVVTSGDYQHSDFTFYDTLSWNNIHHTVGQESETALEIWAICQKL